MQNNNQIPDHIKALAKKHPAIAHALAEGIDVQAILDNLNRSVAERINRHQIALNTQLKLQKAKKL